MRFSTLPLLGLLMLGAAAPARSQAQAPASARAQSAADRQLRALYEAEWAWRQNEFARLPGDDPFEAQGPRLPRVDAATQQARVAYWQRTLDALGRIPMDQLSPEEAINAAVFRTSLEAFVAKGKYRSWEMPFNADSSF